jgi:hypothetical protein
MRIVVIVYGLNHFLTGDWPTDTVMREEIKWKEAGIQRKALEQIASEDLEEFPEFDPAENLDVIFLNAPESEKIKMHPSFLLHKFECNEILPVPRELEVIIVRALLQNIFMSDKWTDRMLQKAIYKLCAPGLPIHRS